MGNIRKLKRAVIKHQCYIRDGNAKGFNKIWKTINLMAEQKAKARKKAKQEKAENKINENDIEEQLA